MGLNKYIQGTPLPSSNPAYRGPVDPALLFGPQSVSQWSPNITVTIHPKLVKAYGLGVGEYLEVYNVYGEGKGEILELFTRLGEDVTITPDNNTITLPLTGRYRLKFSALLGDLVVTSYDVEAPLDRKVDRYITGPGAKQLMLP